MVTSGCNWLQLVTSQVVTSGYNGLQVVASGYRWSSPIQPPTPPTSYSHYTMTAITFMYPCITSPKTHRNTHIHTHKLTELQVVTGGCKWLQVVITRLPLPPPPSSYSHYTMTAITSMYPCITSPKTHRNTTHIYTHTQTN